MYIALALTLSGIVIGRILRNQINESRLGKLIFLAILSLLFLLGAQIGSNDKLFADLPLLGGQALCLMLFCVSGSIIAVKIIAGFWQTRSRSDKRHAR